MGITAGEKVISLLFHLFRLFYRLKQVFTHGLITPSPKGAIFKKMIWVRLGTILLIPFIYKEVNNIYVVASDILSTSRMFYSFLRQINGMTIAIIGSLLSLTLFAILAINYVFVDRLLLDDAQSLSLDAAHRIKKELFSDNTNAFVSLKSRTTEIVDDTSLNKALITLSETLNGQTDARQLPVFTPQPLVGAPKLKEFFDKKINSDAYLNHLNNYAIFLPSGQVYFPENVYDKPSLRKLYSSSYVIVSSVQNVFIKAKYLYSYREKQDAVYTRHFIPLIEKGEVVAVVMLEALQTGAGEKIASAVSNAVSLTTIAGLPIVFLVLYLVWNQLRESLRAQKEISYLSHHDKLTGLPNRVGFYQALDPIIRSNLISKKEFAMVMVDLDGFHKINDEIGHSEGDKILVTVVNRIKSTHVKIEILARLSSDEFVMILPDVVSAQEAADYAEQFKKALAEPYELNGDEIICTVSMGIAFGPDEDVEGESLLKNAKLALYRAKEEGGNTFRFFEPDMDRALQKRRRLEKSLIHAIKREEFELYYQPQVELCGRAITGYEALLRWNHPELGMVSPGEFIPALEETKMIVEVGEYVLRRACREALQWSNNEKVAVNLSAVQFEHQNVPEMVAKALLDTGLPAERLELEITESILISDPDMAIQMLGELKDLGVNIAMDDFGTGYSSLSYISKIEFDKIKIDRSFVSSIQTDERARAIITTVIGLGRTLDIMITAEGIETQEQLLLIQAAGCHFGQGFLFGRPMPLSDIMSNKGDQSQVA